MRAFTYDVLQKKVKGLENDNRQLRAEASMLASDTSAVELREEKLMRNLMAQLSTTPKKAPSVGYGANCMLITMNNFFFFFFKMMPIVI